MPDDGSAQSQIMWPIPKFYFEVKWDAKVMSFQEVSGLDAEQGVIKYRNGDTNVFAIEEIRGIQKTDKITLIKGVYKSNTKFWDWFSQIKMNTATPMPVTIRLLDETGAATMVWTLKNAWPTKITGTDLTSDSNEVVIETIEITHEGLSITNP